MAATSQPQAGPVPALLPGKGVSADEKTVIAEFLVGYAALWLILTAGAEYDATSDFAAALGVTIAIGATYLYLPKVAQGLGLAK